MLLPLMLAVAAQAPADSLTLTSALALARARRGLLSVAAAEVARARADWRTAGSIPNPTASYSFTQSLPKDHATLEQPLDFLLRRGRDRAAARAEIDAAVADSSQLARTVEREARVAFYAALGARRLLLLAQDEAGFADSLAALALRRLEAGEISRLDASQASLEAARTHQLLFTHRAEQVASLAELARSIGLPFDSIASPAGALDADVSDLRLATIALERLPLLAQARAESIAARARWSAARRARIPVPALQVGVEWNDPSEPAQRTFATIGFSLPLPLWHSGGAPAAAAKADAAAAAGRLQETRGELARLITETTVRVREAAQRSLVARDSIQPLAVQQRELALVAYRAGETGIVPVLDALRAERQVAQDLVSDLMAYQEAYANWLALVGGAP